MKNWFITGTSRGFGREWTKAALERGDPTAPVAAIRKVVDSKTPPLRLLLGDFAAGYIKTLDPKRLAARSEWQDVARAADGD